MANLKIKGRTENLIISNEKALRLKEQWFSKSVPRDTKVDLGLWSGEMGEIKQINIENEVTYDTPDTSKYYQTTEEWMQRSMASKISYGIEWFKFVLWGRTTDNRELRNLTEEQKTEIKKILVDFYEANPSDPLPPSELFGELLPPAKSRKNGRIGEMKSIGEIMAQ